MANNTNTGLEADVQNKGSGRKAESKKENKTNKPETKDKRLRAQQSILCDQLSFAAAEAYKLLRANLQFTLPEKPSRCLAVTSSTRGEGKSTTAINLAYSFAESGKRVLLVDGDMRLPTVASRLSVEQAPGLSNLLAGMCEVKDALRVSTYFNNWFILPAGEIPPNPSELLGSERMHDLLEFLSERFDYIILDMPPVGIVSDALVVSSWTDGLLVVVRQNYSSRRALNECMYQIERFNVKFLGFVMTDANVGETSYKRYGGKYGKSGGKYGYSSSGYGYGYGYGKKSYGYSRSQAKVVDAFRDAPSTAANASDKIHPMDE